MSSVRDNTNTPVPGNVPFTPTPGAASPATGAEQPETQAPSAGAQSDAVLQAITARNDQAARENARQKKDVDFNKKYADVPGFGANETDEAKGLKGSFKGAGVAQPLPQNTRAVGAKVADDPAFHAAVENMAQVFRGEAPPPSGKAFDAMMQGVAKSAGIKNTDGATSIGAGAPQDADTVDAGDADGAPLAGDAAKPGRANLAAQDTDVADAADAEPEPGSINAKGSNYANTKDLLPRTSNYTALVFLVMLAAQRETTKEKGDTLRHIKGLNGLQQWLNTDVSPKLISAQQEMTKAQSANTDSNKAGRITVPVSGVPTNIDTQNPGVDETGRIVGNAEYGDDGSSGRVLMNSTDISNKISQVGQWNTTIANNQTQQSNRFQAQDSNMTSTWNIINAVLKNHQDGVNAIVHNLNG